MAFKLAQMGGPEKPRPAPPQGASSTDPPYSTEQARNPPSPVQVAVEAAIASDTPTFYANGFTLGMTNADAFLVLQRFGRPVAVVAVSYTLAKTLAQKLQALVTDWEDKTQQTLQTTDTIDAKFKDAK